jgi:hypothetical protein
VIFSQAKIVVSDSGRVRVTGHWSKYSARISDFLSDLAVTAITVRYRGGRYHFSKGVDQRTQQRIRNYLLNECPVRGQ